MEPMSRLGAAGHVTMGKLLALCVLVSVLSVHRLAPYTEGRESPRKTQATPDTPHGLGRWPTSGAYLGELQGKCTSTPVCQILEV